MSQDVISDGPKTVVTHNRDGCHGGYHYPHDRCDYDGRFNDAGHQRILRAIGDIGERAADRSLALAKALGDSEARQTGVITAGFTMILKDANDNVKSVLKEITDSRMALSKDICDTKTDALKAVYEGRLEAERNVQKLQCGIDSLKLEVLAVCGRRFRDDDCGRHGATVISK